MQAVEAQAGDLFRRILLEMSLLQNDSNRKILDGSKDFLVNSVEHQDVRLRHFP